MEQVIKEIESRKGEIEAAVEALFKANMKITNWDVPENDNKEAAMLILKIMEEKLQQIKKDVENGIYNYY